MTKLSIALLLLSSVVMVGTANAAVQSGITAGSGAIVSPQKGRTVAVELTILQGASAPKVLAIQLANGADLLKVKKAVILALANNRITVSKIKLLDSEGVLLTNESLRNILAGDPMLAKKASPGIIVKLSQ